MSLTPHQAVASALVYPNGVCKAYIWPVSEVNCVCDKNYHPDIKKPPEGKSLAVMVEDEKLEALLDCVKMKESSNGLNLYGDNRHGEYHAFGAYQIWPSKHEDISFDCIMDEPCAREWTRQQIKAERGRWWTSYYPCKAELGML